MPGKTPNFEGMWRGQTEGRDFFFFNVLVWFEQEIFWVSHVDF